MAHLSEGTLRRKFDDEDALTDSDARHFSTCTECQSRYAAMADDARAVAGVLAVPDLDVDVASALDRVRTAPAAQPRFGIRLPIMRPASRPIIGRLAAAAVIVALVVTGVAQDALELLQPDLCTAGDRQRRGPAVAVRPKRIRRLHLDHETGATAGDERRRGGDRLGPSRPGGRYVARWSFQTVSYAAMPKAVGTFTFDAAKAAAAAAKAGKAMPKMPAGMDGAKLTVTVGPAVVVIYGNLGSGSGGTADSTKMSLPQLVVGAATAPVVTSSGVTTQQLEDYLLSQPGVSPKLAAAIKAIKDPSTTLPIPIPVEYATSTPVRVQGVDGVALGDNTGVGAAVVWIKSDTVYGVAGTLKQSAILDVANNLH